MYSKTLGSSLTIAALTLQSGIALAHDGDHLSNPQSNVAHALQHVFDIKVIVPVVLLAFLLYYKSRISNRR